MSQFREKKIAGFHWKDVRPEKKTTRKGKPTPSSQLDRKSKRNIHDVLRWAARSPRSLTVKPMGSTPWKYSTTKTTSQAYSIPLISSRYCWGFWQYSNSSVSTSDLCSGVVPLTIHGKGLYTAFRNLNNLEIID